MTALLMVVGGINLVVGLTTIVSDSSGVSLGNHILVSCALFWMAYSLYEQRKQTDLLREVNNAFSNNEKHPEP